ncbi:MAG: lytic murein transglycosylase B [Gammaproteobacteria bacterium]|nr:lytic murein transglycosylase B [Gammaproteobacteria bacterium]
MIASGFLRTAALLVLPLASLAVRAGEANLGRGHFDLARADIGRFVDQLAAQGIVRERTLALLAAAEPQPKIIEAMERPAEKVLQWWEYRARFLREERIAAGAALWSEHRELLDEVALERQVPPEYIIAILGVETLYGRRSGRYRVLDALATLAFDYPPRADFFRKELGEFIRLCDEDGIDALTALGSYAGAMGAAQFMPSSYRHFAVSAAGSGRRDLWGNWADIFASVANYLHLHGWVPGGPVLSEVKSLGATPPPVPDRVTLDTTVGALAGAGVVIESPPAATTPAVLINATQADGSGWRVGYQNFYVITRYNRSPLYAMAVHDLAGAIRARTLEEPPPAAPAP